MRRLIEKYAYRLLIAIGQHIMYVLIAVSVAVVIALALAVVL